MTPGRDSRRDFVRKLAAGSVLPLARGSGRAPVELINPGKRPGTIFISADASPSEKWAAEQLSVTLEQMTGARMPLTTGDKMPTSSPAVAVGRSVFTERAGTEFPEGESCLLRTSDGTLIIAGGRQRGTMYGVFCFLEKLGCRWYTADVARIPKLQAVKLSPLGEIVRPAFQYREVFFTEAQGTEWSARNRLNGHFHRLDETVGGRIEYQPFAHSFYDLVPPSEHFDSNPEYFALVAGKRRRENAQLCLTDSDVVRMSIQRAQQWLTRNPSLSVVSISQNDGAGWCECEPCQRVVMQEGGQLSGLLLRFVNRVAEALSRSHPGKLVDTLAYQATADPPSFVRPLANVQIRFCPIDACQAHSFQRCEYNRQFQERLTRWSRITPKLVIWQYSINFEHFLAPFPNEQALSFDLPLFQRAGVSGVFVEGAVSDGGGGENAELRSYLAAQLLWNPRTDVAAETRGFLDAVYGPAAPLMSQYLALRQHAVKPKHNLHLWVDQGIEAEYLTQPFLRDGRELLVRARAEAASAPARNRIERQILGFDYVETMRGRRFQVGDGTYAPENAAVARETTAGFLERAKRLGVTHLREGYPLSQQSRDLNDMMNSYAVVKLDDGVAAATIVPGLGARIITFGSSGSHRNILRYPDPGNYLYPMGGGIEIGLASSYLAAVEPVAWRIRSVAQAVALLEGLSQRGLTTEFEARLEHGALSTATRVVNATTSALPVTVRFRAELALQPSRTALITYHSLSGTEQRYRIPTKGRASGSLALSGDQLPRQAWSVVAGGSFTNRFVADQIARCVARWSFRGLGQATLTLWAPETMLEAGQVLTLQSKCE